MDLISQLVFGYIAIAVAMAIAWARAIQINKAGIVDVVWTFALGFLALFYFATIDNSLRGTRQWIVTALVVAWSLRLGIYLYRRVGRESDDSRYHALKKHWGGIANLKFFVFFQLQALADSFLSIAFLIALRNQSPFGSFWDWAALLVALIALVGEGVADRQLKRFKSRPENAGKTCREGLWRYSRHPNYFFEWLYWWSFPLFAISVDWFWLTLLSPLVMLALILKVTGIPPTEMQALKRRGDDYRRYQQETSAFVPWFTHTSKN